MPRARGSACRAVCQWSRAGSRALRAYTARDRVSAADGARLDTFTGSGAAGSPRPDRGLGRRKPFNANEGRRLAGEVGAAAEAHLVVIVILGVVDGNGSTPAADGA